MSLAWLPWNYFGWANVALSLEMTEKKDEASVDS